VTSIPPIPSGRRWHRDTKAEWVAWHEGGMAATWTPAQKAAARQLLVNVEEMHRTDDTKLRLRLAAQVRLERNDLGLGGKAALPDEPKPDPFEHQRKRGRFIRSHRDPRHDADRSTDEAAGRAFDRAGGDLVEAERLLGWDTTARQRHAAQMRERDEHDAADARGDLPDTYSEVLPRARDPIGIRAPAPETTTGGEQHGIH
jgi:hypothetical protein